MFQHRDWHFYCLTYNIICYIMYLYKLKLYHGAEMKVYFKVVLGCVITILVIGGVLPYLFSAESDLLVVSGVIVLTLMVPFSYFYIRWVLNK